MAALAAIAAVGWLAGCGDDEPRALDDQSGGLIQVTAPPTTPPPTTEPPPTTIPETTTTLAEEDAIAGCFDYLMFQVAAEDPETLDLWEELGEDEDALRDECARIAEDDPERVVEMIEQKRLIDEYLSAIAAETTEP